LSHHVSFVDLLLLALGVKHACPVVMDKNEVSGMQKVQSEDCLLKAGCNVGGQKGLYLGSLGLPRVNIHVQRAEKAISERPLYRQLAIIKCTYVTNV